MTKSQIEISGKKHYQEFLKTQTINFDTGRYPLTKPVHYNFGDYPPKENANESLKQQ